MPNLLHFLPDSDALYALRPTPNFYEIHSWYAEFLREIDLKILLRKTVARLNFKITLMSLQIDPDANEHLLGQF
jgi:hypothetical protein